MLLFMGNPLHLRQSSHRAFLMSPFLPLLPLQTLIFLLNLSVKQCCHLHPCSVMVPFFLFPSHRCHVSAWVSPSLSLRLLLCVSVRPRRCRHCPTSLSIWLCPVITVSTICRCHWPCRPYPASLKSAICFGRGPSLGRSV